MNRGENVLECWECVQRNLLLCSETKERWDVEKGVCMYVRVRVCCTYVCLGVSVHECMYDVCVYVYVCVWIYMCVCVCKVK